MLSTTAEYALRAIVFLADNQGSAHTADAISSVTRVPAGYLAKILQGLARGGMISSQRGPSGGFTLVADPTTLTALDVIQVIDPITRIEKCPLDLVSHGTRLCALHRMLDGAAAMVQKHLQGVTISALVAQRRGGSHPLCDFPRHAAPDPDKAVRRE